MVKPTTAREALRKLREQGKAHGLVVVEAKDPRGRGRGKGGYAMYLLVDDAGEVCARIVLPQHPGALSVGVTRSIEAGCEHLFGKGWMRR